jgi:exonuclease III
MTQRHVRHCHHHVQLAAAAFVFAFFLLDPPKPTMRKYLNNSRARTTHSFGHDKSFYGTEGAGTRNKQRRKKLSPVCRPAFRGDACIMLIMSWNIAGLKTSTQRIVQHYGGLESYFYDRHLADIVCLQEHKIAKSILADRSIPSIIGGGGGYHGGGKNHKRTRKSSADATAAADSQYYESFWSCCTDDRYKGLNGVVTYARIGTVRRASASPLTMMVRSSNNNKPEEDWNAHGRCLLTDHGSFVLFNVYVPCASSSSSLPLKMKFLRALRRAMQRERNENGRAILLVGDLNISCRRHDVCWKWRSVYINDILQKVAAYRRKNPAAAVEAVEHTNTATTTTTTTVETDSDKNEKRFVVGTTEDLLPQWWMIDVADHWPTIQHLLESKTAILTKTTNPTTGETFDKYRVVVPVVDDNGRCRNVYLGSYETTSAACLGRYDFTERSYYDDELDQRVVYCEANTVEVEILGELMTKLAGLPAWNINNNDSSDAVTLLRQIADDTTYVGCNRASPAGQWLQSIQVEDDMVDAFAHLFPYAQGRFTCWNQNKNCRYTNEGARIDYTLLDRSLLPYLRRGNNSPLAVTGDGDNNNDKNDTDDDPSRLVWTEEAALQAATAAGQFRPVGYHGGGMIEASQQALDTQFAKEPHTGLVYTPPTYSDHIGVSLYLDDQTKNASSPSAAAVAAAVPLELDTSDVETRRAQPHKQQKSIASFFAARPTGGSDAKQPPTNHNKTARVVAAAKPKSPPNRNSITYHFQKK